MFFISDSESWSFIQSFHTLPLNLPWSLKCSTSGPVCSYSLSTGPFNLTELHSLPPLSCGPYFFKHKRPVRWLGWTARGKEGRLITSRSEMHRWWAALWARIPEEWGNRDTAFHFFFFFFVHEHPDSAITQRGCLDNNNLRHFLLRE